MNGAGGGRLNVQTFPFLHAPISSTPNTPRTFGSAQETTYFLSHTDLFISRSSYHPAPRCTTATATHRRTQGSGSIPPLSPRGSPWGSSHPGAGGSSFHPPKTIGQRGMRSPLPRVSCPEPDQPAESHGALRLTWHKESRRDERALPAPGALPALRSGSRRPTAVAHPSAAPRAAPPPLWAAGRAPLSISGGGARPPLASRRQ